MIYVKLSSTIVSDDLTGFVFTSLLTKEGDLGQDGEVDNKDDVDNDDDGGMYGLSVFQIFNQ